MSKLTTVLKAISGADTKMEFTGHLTIKMSDLKIEYNETKIEDYHNVPSEMHGEVQLKDFEISGDVNAALAGFLKLVNSVGDALHRHPSDDEKSCTCNCGKTECDSEPAIKEVNDTRDFSASDNEIIKSRNIIECVNRYLTEDDGRRFTKDAMEIVKYDSDCLHGETLLSIAGVDCTINKGTVYAIRVPYDDCIPAPPVERFPFKVKPLASAFDGSFYYFICV